MDVVYFELNNWFAGRDYPNAEPFLTWCGDDTNLYFDNEEWIKDNKLVVVGQFIDMSSNWCITAPKQWVLDNCPDLLSDYLYKYTTIIHSGDEKVEKEHFEPYNKFLRHPDEDGDVYGRFGTKFLEYSEENIGLHWEDEELYSNGEDEE